MLLHLQGADDDGLAIIVAVKGGLVGGMVVSKHVSGCNKRRQRVLKDRDTFVQSISQKGINELKRQLERTKL